MVINDVVYVIERNRKILLQRLNPQLSELRRDIDPGRSGVMDKMVSLAKTFRFTLILKVIYHPLHSMNNFVTNKLSQDGAQVFPYYSYHIRGDRSPLRM